VSLFAKTLTTVVHESVRENDHQKPLVATGCNDVLLIPSMVVNMIKLLLSSKSTFGSDVITLRATGPGAESDDEDDEEEDVEEAAAAAGGAAAEAQTLSSSRSTAIRLPKSMSSKWYGLLSSF